MSEVDVFTTSEKQLRDLAASLSRLRLELQFGARLHSGIAIPTYVRSSAPQRNVATCQLRPNAPQQGSTGIRGC